MAVMFNAQRGTYLLMLDRQEGNTITLNIDQIRNNIGTEVDSYRKTLPISNPTYPGLNTLSRLSSYLYALSMCVEQHRIA